MELNNSVKKWTEKRILIVVIYQLFWASFFFELFLTLLETVTVLTTNRIPDELQGYYTGEIFAASKHRSYVEDWFMLILSLISCTLATVVIRRKIIWRVWELSLKIVRKISLVREELFTSIISIFILTLAQSLPEILYEILMNPLLKFHDIVFELISLAVIVLILPVLIYYGTKKIGSKFYIYFIVVCSVLLFAFLLMYNEISSLLMSNEIARNDTDLEDEIANLTGKASVPSEKIYFVKNDHINAYMSGFFSAKQIVIFSTFLQCVKCNRTACENTLTPCPEVNETSSTQQITYRRYFTNDEVLAVIAHEIGHWKGNHSIVALIAIMLPGTAIWLACSVLYRKKYLYEVFNFHEIQPAVIGFYLINMFIVWPINNGLLSYLLNVVMRQFEYEADRYANSLGYGPQLISALIKAHILYSRFPISNKLFSIFRMEHPTLMERIENINR